MALFSGITPDTWADMGEQAIITAVDLLETSTTRNAESTPSSGKEAPEGWESL